MPKKIRADEVGNTYKAFVKEAKTDLKGTGATARLRELTEVAITFLDKFATLRELTSQVVGKSYGSFALSADAARLSRPVNTALFDSALALRKSRLLGTEGFAQLSEKQRDKVLYTCAAAFCCANDLIRRDDRKTPGTFFEYYVAHLVARSYDVNPRAKIEILNLGMKATLPTDFIFDMGDDKSKLHLPVKLSTRERVIQVWAHQRVLDGVYGVNRFRGVLVCMTETNFKREEGAVVEICLPDQWTIYQMFIAQLTRVYYLDPPTIYRQLRTKYPFINVASFGTFFAERDALVTSGVDG